jgi:hypothetical protein
MAYKIKHKKSKKDNSNTLKKIWVYEGKEERRFYNQKP